MGSSSSDNDSLIKVDNVELSEEYDASVWRDEDCLRPFEEPNEISSSRFCHACQSLFSGYKETEKNYKHFYRLSTLQNTAKRGCQLCALVLSKVDRENQNHRPSEVIKLTFQIYQASSQNGETAFEIWFHFLRICKGAKDGDVVWGIKSIDFLLSNDMSETAIGSHQISLNSQSQENRLLANRWLKNCTVSHERCNHSRTRQNWLPTRLLDLSCAETEASKIFVVESTSIPSNVEYLSLSHCWGSKPVISLSRANFESLKRGISISDLPKTFQDSITVAGWFQCKYLWIDSLCIIQDCIEDWRKESAEMRQVYKNAWLNIAATGAPDSFSGLFFDRNPALVSTGLVSVSWDGDLPQGTFHFFLRHVWAHGVGRAPLSRRAWVVQERFLARRNLHFGSESLFFECHELEACETFPAQLPTIFERKLVNRFKGVYPSTDRSPAASTVSFLKSWQKIIHTYMECDLTYASDKMIALSGVADEFRSTSNGMYLAGLWKNCFFTEQLLWIARHNNKQVNGRPSARPSIYRAPSWSWLSIDAEISLPLIFEPSFIEILDVSVDLVDEFNPTGPVKGGTISIRGHLKRAKLQKKHNIRTEFYADDEYNNRMGLIEVDYDEAAIRPTQAFCLPIRFSRPDVLEGLLLVPTGEKPMEFKRAGHFTSDDLDIHEKLVKERDQDKNNFSVV